MLLKQLSLNLSNHRCARHVQSQIMPSKVYEKAILKSTSILNALKCMYSQSSLNFTKKKIHQTLFLVFCHPSIHFFPSPLVTLLFLFNSSHGSSRKNISIVVFFKNEQNQTIQYSICQFEESGLDRTEAALCERERKKKLGYDGLDECNMRAWLGLAFMSTTFSAFFFVCCLL